MIVWVLVVVLSSTYGGRTVVVDDIASREECVRLGEAIFAAQATPDRLRANPSSRCYAVRKARP
jgi:hypothetical protein